MIFWDQAVALFIDGFVKVSQASGGGIKTSGEGQKMYLVLSEGRVVTKTIEEYVHDGYYKGWHIQMPLLLDEILVPVVVEGFLDSGLAFLDMYEELGLGVFHRHEENDRIWKRNCADYRRQIRVYAQAT